MDVVLKGVPADARARYQIARDLAALGPGAPLFAAAQQALAIPGSVVASGVTREDSLRVLEVLEEHGARARTTAAVEDVPVPAEAPGGGGSGFVVVLILLALVGFGLWAWIRNLGADSGEIDLPQQSARADQGPRAQHPRARGARHAGHRLAAMRELARLRLLCRPRPRADQRARALRAGRDAARGLRDGREIPAAVEQRDDWLDLALVRVPGAGVQPLPLGDMTALRTGDLSSSPATPRGWSSPSTRGWSAAGAQRSSASPSCRSTLP